MPEVRRKHGRHVPLIISLIISYPSGTSWATGHDSVSQWWQHPAYFLQFSIFWSVDSVCMQLRPYSVPCQVEKCLWPSSVLLLQFDKPWSGGWWYLLMKFTGWQVGCASSSCTGKNFIRDAALQYESVAALQIQTPGRTKLCLVLLAQLMQANHW